MLRLNLWSFVEVALAFPKLRIFQARRCAEPRHASTDDHYTQWRAGRAGSGHRGRSLKKRNSPISLSELTIEMGPCDVGYKTKRQLELLYPKLGF